MTVWHVLDWERVAWLIRAKRPVFVKAGVIEDWHASAVTIYNREYGPVLTDDLLASITGRVGITIDMQPEPIACDFMARTSQEELVNWPVVALEVICGGLDATRYDRGSAGVGAGAGGGTSQDHTY